VKLTPGSGKRPLHLFSSAYFQKVVFGDKIPLYCNKIKKKHSLFEAGLKDQVTERPNDSAKNIKSKSVRPFTKSSLVLKQLNSLI
jgi:hypothetical protein